MFRPLLLAFAAPLLATACVTAPALEAPASPRIEPRGAAAANDPRVSAIGESILAKGGNATDAALAMAFALTVIEPQSSGLGGGAFYVRGAPDGTVNTIDGRERAPAAATPDWFLGPDGEPIERGAAVRSGLSIGVPGLVALAAKAHRAHGGLAWRDLLAPSIALARDGFEVNIRLNRSLADLEQTAARDPDARALYFDADGEPLAPGTLLRIPALADTFERVAEQGQASFHGPAASNALAAEIAADTPREGAMTAADIAGYEAIERPPVCGFYRRYRICGMGPPSSGPIALIAILGQLERFDLAALGPRNPVTWHLFLESQRLAYADREHYLADSDFVAVPVAGLLDPAYLAQRSLLIDPARRMPAPEPGRPPGAEARIDGPEWPENGTSHLVAVDAEGTMVSINTTIEAGFGSGLFVDGFFLNNELTDFTFVPRGEDGRLVANRVEGGKRPRSSMSPVVIYDPQGRPFMTAGAAGGPLIPVQTARAIVGVIDFGLPLAEALRLPFIMGFGPTVIVEEGTWLEQAIPAFEALGHERVRPFDGLLRTTAAVRTEDGWVARMDPRLDDLVTIR